MIFTTARSAHYLFYIIKASDGMQCEAGMSKAGWPRMRMIALPHTTVREHHRLARDNTAASWHAGSGAEADMGRISARRIKH